MIRRSKNSYIWHIPEYAVNGPCPSQTGGRRHSSSPSDSTTGLQSCNMTKNKKISLLLRYDFGIYCDPKIVPNKTSDTVCFTLPIFRKIALISRLLFLREALSPPRPFLHKQFRCPCRNEWSDNIGYRYIFDEAVGMSLFRPFVVSAFCSLLRQPLPTPVPTETTGRPVCPGRLCAG